MMRVVAWHITLKGVDEPPRFAQWIQEVARSEGAEGWVCVAGDVVEAWFEGSSPVVDAMVTWCATHDAARGAEVSSNPQRPCLRGAFHLLDEVPSV